MKIRCPNCACKEVEPLGEGTLHCKSCDFGFRPDEGLLRLGDAVALGKALTHEIRRSILLAFDGRYDLELSPTNLAQTVDAPLGDVSYHVRVLARMDPPLLIPTRTQKTHGTVEHFYRVNSAV